MKQESITSSKTTTNVIDTPYPITIVVVDDLKLVINDDRIIDKAFEKKEVHNTLFDHMLPSLAAEPTLELIQRLYKRYQNRKGEEFDYDFCILTVHAQLICAIGYWIEKKLIPHDAIELVLYRNSSTREIRRCTYDEKGVLCNWSIGYMDFIND